MIVNKDAYYVDIGKTGSTFIEKHLMSIIATDHDQWRKYTYVTSKEEPPREVNIESSNRHGRLYDYSNGFYDDKLIYCSLRHPLRYYTSLFNRELAHQGPIKSELLKQDSSYEDTFGNFVNCILDNTKVLSRQEMPRYFNRPKNIGLLTYRYIDWVDDSFFTVKRDWAEVENWYERHYFNPDVNIEFIGPQNLGQSFVDLIKKYRDKFDLKQDWEEHIPAMTANRLVNSTTTYLTMGRMYKESPQFLPDRILEAERILLDRFDFGEWGVDFSSKV